VLLRINNICHVYVESSLKESQIISHFAINFSVIHCNTISKTYFRSLNISYILLSPFFNDTGGGSRSRWPDRGFESRSRHGCLSFVFLCCVVLRR
jgi:hypothetical protein